MSSGWDEYWRPRAWPSSLCASCGREATSGGPIPSSVHRGYHVRVRSTWIAALGTVASLAYGGFIVWVYATQPRTLAEVRTGAQVAAGVYQVDEARFDAGLDLFRREQHAAARDEWSRADPARRDARTQFYVAYSCYRQGWGRLHHEDSQYRQGLEAIDRALSLAPDGALRIEDPTLGIKTAAELKAELEKGVTRSWEDFNPLKVLEPRK